MINSQLIPHADADERGSVQVALSIIAPIVWKWYAVHSDDALFTLKILFIKKTFRVSDARVILVGLFGPPTAVPQ